MPEIETIFNRIAQFIEQGEISHALNFLADHFRDEKKFPELFETLKARIRYELGLPILYLDDPDELDDQQQRELEDQLLDACREVGTLLMQDGEIVRGWMYLQPLPDQETVQSIIEGIELSDENIDEVIEVALGQWGAPAFGYQLLMKHRGTCNAITFYDTQVVAQNVLIRRQLADLLVHHVYEELCDNIRRCVNERANDRLSSAEGTLSELIENRTWLFEGCGHHLDVTHLASALRIARACQNEAALRQALQLACYGCCLDEQLYTKGAGEPPFEDIFAGHRFFFQALLGIDLDDSLNYFENKTLDTNFELSGTLPCEVLIELLARTGNASRAIDHASRLNESVNQNDVGISIVELAQSGPDYQQVMNVYRRNQDLLGFSISACQKKIKSES